MKPFGTCSTKYNAAHSPIHLARAVVKKPRDFELEFEAGRDVVDGGIESCKNSIWEVWFEHVDKASLKPITYPPLLGIAAVEDVFALKHKLRKSKDKNGRLSRLERRSCSVPTAASTRTDLVRSDLAWSLGCGGAGPCGPTPSARPSAANTRARHCFLASASGPKLWPYVCAVIK
jgi:hypothetical protein